MSAPIILTHEGNGHVLTCSGCQWVRFYTARPEAEAGRVQHAAKCKGGDA